MSKQTKNIIKITLFGAIAAMLSACGGGGGGYAGGSGSVLYYPYETVYGDVCSTFEATPGCTFSRTTGARITVTADPDYNKYGFGSDDLWYVSFDSFGRAAVYDDLGHFQYYTDVSKFSGYVGGAVIGVGQTGLYWENVAGGTYWLGKNGVLYSANTFNSNYGQAINNKNSGAASQTSFAALNSDANKKLVEKGAQRLISDYGMEKTKAVAVASALNSWAVASAERGYTTATDMDKTFKTVFGVNYMDALSAVKDLQSGDTSSMKDLTNRSAAALGLKPDQAQKFVKGMYKKALSQFGYDSDSVKW